MLISIQDELIDIKEYLVSRGYRVKNISEGCLSDVYIYSKASISHPLLSSSMSAGCNGSLMIDIDSTSIDSLEYVLNNRVYSPIFD